jgi:hypothetical protein
MRWVGYVACVGKTNVYKNLIRKPERKRTPRYKYEDNVSMHLTELGCKAVDWIHVVQQRANGGFL